MSAGFLYIKVTQPKSQNQFYFASAGHILKVRNDEV